MQGQVDYSIGSDGGGQPRKWGENPNSGKLRNSSSSRKYTPAPESQNAGSGGNFRRAYQGGFSGGRSRGTVRKYVRSKVPCLRWTTAMNKSFEEIVERLGGHNRAKPKLVLQLMDVKGLTRAQVKSRLQVYRIKKDNEIRQSGMIGSGYQIMGEQGAANTTLLHSSFGFQGRRHGHGEWSSHRTYQAGSGPPTGRQEGPWLQLGGINPGTASQQQREALEIQKIAREWDRCLAHGVRRQDWAGRHQSSRSHNVTSIHVPTSTSQENSCIHFKQLVDPNCRSSNIQGKHHLRSHEGEVLNSYAGWSALFGSLPDHITAQRGPQRYAEQSRPFSESDAHTSSPRAFMPRQQSEQVPTRSNMDRESGGTTLLLFPYSSRTMGEQIPRHRDDHPLILRPDIKVEDHHHSFQARSEPVTQDRKISLDLTMSLGSP